MMSVSVARAQFSTVLHVPPNSAPAAIGSNTQLNLSAGGTIGASFDAGAADGSSTNVEVNISGGTVGLGFDANSGATVNISGGVVGDIFRALGGSAIHISGGEFRLDGQPIDGLTSVGATLTATPPEGAVLSGTLVDGTPFALSTLDGDLFEPGTLTLEVTELPVIEPSSMTISSSAARQGIRTGQSLRLESGGVLPAQFSAGAGSTVAIAGGQVGENFEAVDAVITISGGVVGDRFDALVGSEVTISGGSVGTLFDATDGSIVSVFGGSIGGNMDAFAGSIVTIAGGSVGERFRAFDGSTVNIERGSIGPQLDAFSGSTLNISGGTVGPDIDVLPGSAVNILGSQFFLGGAEITELDIGQSMTITERNVTLGGRLADGRPFSFDLGTSNAQGEDFFAADATLTITRRAASISGDYNNDGTVTAADYVVWRNHEGTAFDLPNRDPSATGNVGEADYQFWVANFGSTLESSSSIPHSAFRTPHSNVPEPASTVLLAIAALMAKGATAAADRGYQGIEHRALRARPEPGRFRTRAPVLPPPK